jgi:hypothetical protein
VKNYTTKRFRAMRDALPDTARRAAFKAFDIFKTDPAHPSLDFQKVGDLYRVAFGNGYRAIAFKDEAGDLVWIFIGTHADYDKVKKQ